MIDLADLIWLADDRREDSRTCAPHCHLAEFGPRNLQRDCREALRGKPSKMTVSTRETLNWQPNSTGVVRGSVFSPSLAPAGFVPLVRVLLVHAHCGRGSARVGGGMRATNSSWPLPRAGVAQFPAAAAGGGAGKVPI